MGPKSTDMRFDFARCASYAQLEGTNASQVTPMPPRFSSFREFYPYYLGEHTSRRCRRLHFIGSWLVIAWIIVAIATRNSWWLIAVPLCGYGFAWFGHYVYEKNRPATFRHPLYSLLGDWVMFGQALMGKVSV
jgi:hypothetical protein